MWFLFISFECPTANVSIQENSGSLIIIVGDPWVSSFWICGVVYSSTNQLALKALIPGQSVCRL